MGKRKKKLNILPRHDFSAYSFETTVHFSLMLKMYNGTIELIILSY